MFTFTVAKICKLKQQVYNYIWITVYIFNNQNILNINNTCCQKAYSANGVHTQLSVIMLSFLTLV